MYSCHGVFTDQFLFRTIFALIRISFILTFIIINTFSFPFAKICHPEVKMFFHGYHHIIFHPLLRLSITRLVKRVLKRGVQCVWDISGGREFGHSLGPGEQRIHLLSLA